MRERKEPKPAQTPLVAVYEADDYQEVIRSAAQLLQQGKLVVLPTETVYGAAGLLKQPGVVERLRGLRSDGHAKPLIPHVIDRAQAGHFLGPVGDLGERMMRKLWPGPVALVFDVPEGRRREVAAEMGVAEADLFDGSTVILRNPDHPVATDVIREGDGLVVAVRAGSSRAALRGQDAARDLDGKVDLVLDAGPTKYAKASTIVRVTDSGYEIVRGGVYDRRIIERLLRTTILFVCSGNTCRSPMAEIIARQVLAGKLNTGAGDLESKGITVLSAGSVAVSGAQATPQAVEAVKLMGADLADHRSRPLSVELIHQADVIFAMGRSHAAAVAALVPAAIPKVSMLNPDRDVDDPIGGDARQYQELAGQLRLLIEERFKEKSLP